MSQVQGRVAYKNRGQDRRPAVEVADGRLVELLGDMRARLAQLDAVTNAANDVARDTQWDIPTEQRRRLGRLTRLLADAADAATATVDEVDRRLPPILKYRRNARARRA